MKNLIIFIILTLLLFSCDKYFDNKKVNGFYINGKVEDISDSTKVHLMVQKSNKIIVLDSTHIINHVFQFKGKIDKPEVFGVYIDSLKGFIGLFIENDSVFIKVNKDKLGDSKIKGSELNDKYLSFVKKSNQIISKTNYLFPLFQKARTENDFLKLREINDKIEAIQKENRTYVLNFARENSQSYIAAFALQTLLKNELVSKDTIAEIYDNFSHKVKKGDFAIEILLFLESQEVLETIEH